MLLDVLPANLQTCRACRRERGIIDPPIGVRLCPEDGATCLSHAETGKCPLGLFKTPAPASAPKSPAESNPAPVKGGPGTELKKLLAKVGIVASPSCRCNVIAAAMDASPPQWSIENIEMIVDVMRTEAARRGFPFVAAVARIMVRRAVGRAKRAASDTAVGSDPR